MTAQDSKEYEKSPYDYRPDEYKLNFPPGKFDQHHCKKKIAILGAGMSGLVCARLLKQAGHSVTIFEASNVIGGRVKTLRDPFSDGCYAEAGAMRVPGNHSLTLSLIEEFGLEKLDFFPHCDEAYYHINRRPFVKVQDYEAKPEKLGFEVNDNEKGYTARQLFTGCVKAHMERVHNWNNFSWASLAGDEAEYRPTNHDIDKEMDNYSLRQFLENAKFPGNNGSARNLSKEAANHICAVLVLDMSLSASMTSVLRMFKTIYASANFWQIEGGMDKLPRGFLEKGHLRKYDPDTNEGIRYNTRVTAIDDSPHTRPKVHYENTNTRWKDDEDFDLVVVSIPFSALHHVRVPEIMTSPKRRAIRQLHYDNACKVLLEFETNFWRPIIGGRSITDLPVRQVHYPNPKQNENRILLASYTWGQDSLRWTSLKNDDRIRFALRDLGVIHNHDRLDKLFVGGMSHSWEESEYTCGAFTVFEPSQCIELFDGIWRPEGRLHFCGEHTSLKHGWIEGAIESGIRVANEVCTRIKCYPKLDR